MQVQRSVDTASVQRGCFCSKPNPFPHHSECKYLLQVGKWGSNLSCNLYHVHRAGDHWAAASSALTERRRKQQRANKRHRMWKTDTRCEFFHKVLKYTLGTRQVNEIVWLTTTQWFVFQINCPQPFLSYRGHNILKTWKTMPRKLAIYFSALS